MSESLDFSWVFIFIVTCLQRELQPRVTQYEVSLITVLSVATETSFDSSEDVVISALHKSSAMLPLSGLSRHADAS